MKNRHKILLAIVGLSVCSCSKESTVTISTTVPVLSEITTSSTKVVYNRSTTYSINITNFSEVTGASANSSIGEGNTYTEIDLTADGTASADYTLTKDSTISFKVYYKNIEENKFEYIYQEYNAKVYQPYFKTFIFGDSLDYVYPRADILPWSYVLEDGKARYNGDPVAMDEYDMTTYYYFSNSTLNQVSIKSYFDVSFFGFEDLVFFNMGGESNYTNRYFGSQILNFSSGEYYIAIINGYEPTGQESLIIEEFNNAESLDDYHNYGYYDMLDTLLKNGSISISFITSIADLPELEFSDTMYRDDQTPTDYLMRYITLKEL